MALSTMYALVVMIAGLAAVSSECSQKEESKTYTLEWRVMFSDLVGHGVVLSVDHDNDLSEKSYSVIFEMRCIYKGKPVNEKLRIILAGYNPNNCLSTNLTEGISYIVFLKRVDDGEYYQEFKPDLADSQSLDEVTVLCDASVDYPIGRSKDNNKEECLEAYQGEGCVPSPNITTTVKHYNEDGDGEGDEPYKPMQSSVLDEDGGRNGVMALTWSMGTLPCLLLLLLIARILKL